MAGVQHDERDRDRPAFDPRREARRQLARVALPDDVRADQLDGDARKELLTLARDTAETVARHLVMVGALVDEDPTAALSHARAARALAGRVAVAREANGLAAYAAGEWAEALTELRTARRISGDPSQLPVMADCERALGRPDRALLVAEDPQTALLAAAARVELLIVTSGARRDLGQHAAAVASLEVGALEGAVRPWTARLRYAYADALLDCGREQEAREWFSRTADIDPDGDTDAVDRLLELDGIVLDLAAADEPAPAAAAHPEPPLPARATEQAAPRTVAARADGAPASGQPPEPAQPQASQRSGAAGDKEVFPAAAKAAGGTTGWPVGRGSSAPWQPAGSEGDA